eukprot:PhF_6_TR31499/c0_g3_i1/m.46365
MLDFFSMKRNKLSLQYVEHHCKLVILLTDIGSVDKFFEKNGEIVYQPNTSKIGSKTSVGWTGVVRRHEPYKDVPIVKYTSPELNDSHEASYVVVVHGESGSGKMLNSIRAAAEKLKSLCTSQNTTSLEKLFWMKRKQKMNNVITGTNRS